MPTYAWQIRFDCTPERLAEVRPAHRRYLQGLFDEGHLRISGPYSDDSGALIVYDVDSRAAARALVDRDPFTIEGIATEVALREWNVVFCRDEVE